MVGDLRAVAVIHHVTATGLDPRSVLAGLVAGITLALAVLAARRWWRRQRAWWP